MNLRVAHIVPALFDSNDGILGGAERYAFELARHMSESVDTTLVSFGTTARQESFGKLKVKVLGPARFVRGQRTNPVAAGYFSAMRRASVVHCHQQHIFASTLAAFYCRMTGRKVFVSDLGGGGWDLSGYVSTDSWFHGHLHLSEFSRKIFGHERLPNAHVISGGVDIEKFAQGSNRNRDGVIRYIGRVLPHKGIENLIQAVDQETPVEIIGDQQDQKYLNDLKSLANGKKISFSGKCSDEDLIRKYQSSLCIVLPSVYKTIYGDTVRIPELLGQTLLESMSCGTPVICSDVASMPELVKDRVTGFVVPPNDPQGIREKLEWFKQHPEEVENMGKSARDHVVRNFRWASVVERCLRVYER